MEDVAGFRVGGFVYERHTVGIDRRPTQLNKEARGQGTDRKTVFLLNLVEGPRALYAYRNERRHFPAG